MMVLHRWLFVLHRCLLVLQTSVLILFKDGLFRISMFLGFFKLVSRFA